MRITRDGSLIQVGDATIGPGTAQGLAQIIRRKLREEGAPVVIEVGGRWVRIRKSSAARQAATLLEKHAAAAEVVRGPLNRGPIRDARDVFDQMDGFLGDWYTILKKGH